MGKGDKKTRRGKIILGTFGARRRHKKADKAAIKPMNVVTDKEVKDKKPVKEKSEVREVKPVEEVKEVKEVKVPRERVAAKATKVVKEKKEVPDNAGESKPKKEKKS
jgi:30S ribosomal protein S31